jgi:hypothetical protein
MRGSHLGMRTPRMGGALSTRSSHAHVRTAARRRCAVRIWGCELRGWGVLSTRSSHAHGRTAARRRCAVRIWGCELRGWGGRCQRGVRTPTGERRPGDDARFASGDANSADGGALSTRSSHAHVRTAARRRCAVRIWGCELRGWGGCCQRGVRTPTGERRPGDDARFASGDANSADGGGVVNAEFARPRANGGQETMRGSHLGMRTPRMGGALSTRSSHAHGRTAARRRCAVRIWGCELRGWGGALSTRSSHAHGRTAARRRCAVRIWGCELRGWGGRCQRGVRTPTCERRPGDDARFASGDANSADGGGRCQRGVRTPSCERRPGDDARFASGDANSADGGGVVNAEFARPRANGGQETMRGSHLGMRTPRMGGALSTRSSHAHVRTAARRRCAVRIWGCELRGWGGRCQRGVRTPTGERRPGDDARFASGDANSADGGGVVNAEFARPRANGGQETMRGSHLGMRTPRMGGALSTRSSHAHGRTAARRRCAVRIWGCELRGWGGRCQRGVRTPTGERRPGDDARFASGDANSADGGGVVNAEFARPRANGGQETMRGSHLGMRTPRMGGVLSTRSSHAHGRTAARRRCAVRIWGCELRGWGGVVNAEFARPRANGGQETMRGSHLGMRTPRMGGGVVNAEFARPRANGG